MATAVCVLQPGHSSQKLLDRWLRSMTRALDATHTSRRHQCHRHAFATHVGLRGTALARVRRSCRVGEWALARPPYCCLQSAPTGSSGLSSGSSGSLSSNKESAGSAVLHAECAQHAWPACSELPPLADISPPMDPLLRMSLVAASAAPALSTHPPHTMMLLSGAVAPGEPALANTGVGSALLLLTMLLPASGSSVSMRRWNEPCSWFFTNCQMCCTSSEARGLTRKASAPRRTHSCTREICARPRENCTGGA